MNLRLTISSCISILFINACSPDLTFKSSKVLDHYPSGSGMAYLNGIIYLIGDDAPFLLLTDTVFNAIDSIRLIESDQYRISKDLKQDLEAAAVVWMNRSQQILLLGSGSLAPNRNYGWLIDPSTKEKVQLDLEAFYSRIRKERIQALNIEGATSIQGGIVLASRGNKSFPANHLIFTTNQFWNKQDSASIKIIKAGTNSDTASFSGISGLDYSKMSDQLLMTVSTENTASSVQDGAIGKSYLWIINNISFKRNMIAVNPNRIIDLEVLDERFKGHKIESVCILSENKNEMELALVADDDKGTSILFKVILKK